MTTPLERPRPRTLRRVRQGVQVVSGLALVGYGVTILLDEAATPPAAAYFVVAALLLASAVGRARQ